MNRYLLDTHVVLWFAEYSSKLSDRVYSVIQSEDSDIFVSLASAWEVAIKLGTGKLELDGGLSEFYRIIDNNGFLTLPIKRDCISNTLSLPNHHKDPFDRIIISTAIIDDMTLITVDENIRKYDLSLLW